MVFGNSYFLKGKKKTENICEDEGYRKNGDDIGSTYKRNEV